MRKKSLFLSMAALMCIAMVGLTGCIKDYKIQVSTNNLWFDLNAGSKTMSITSNCKWTITKNDDADWYTINTMSGKNDAILTITVDAMNESDYRGSSFVISSPGSHVHRTIFVSQNKLEFYDMVNKVYGLMFREKWNTDYYGQIIEDTYKTYEYNPYDTTTGYHMYFLENGQGIQRDHHADTVAYYLFTYDYNPIDQMLHIEFETVFDTVDPYDVQVLTASDSLYRFVHEYKPSFWERADMRKVGVINPSEKAILWQKATKRQKGEPIFLD